MISPMLRARRQPAASHSLQRKRSDHHQEVVAKLVDAGMLPEAAEQLMQTRWSAV